MSRPTTLTPGVLLYEMLHKKAPFRGRRVNDVKKQIKRNQISFNDKTSEELKSLILSMLQVVPKRRPSSSEILHLPFIHKIAIQLEQEFEIQDFKNSSKKRKSKKAPGSARKVKTKAKKTMKRSKTEKYPDLGFKVGGNDFQPNSMVFHSSFLDLGASNKPKNALPKHTSFFDLGTIHTKKRPPILNNSKHKQKKIRNKPKSRLHKVHKNITSSGNLNSIPIKAKPHRALKHEYFPSSIAELQIREENENENPPAKNLNRVVSQSNLQNKPFKNHKRFVSSSSSNNLMGLRGYSKSQQFGHVSKDAFNSNVVQWKAQVKQTTGKFGFDLRGYGTEQETNKKSEFQKIQSKQASKGFFDESDDSQINDKETSLNAESQNRKALDAKITQKANLETGTKPVTHTSTKDLTAKETQNRTVLSSKFGFNLDGYVKSQEWKIKGKDNFNNFGDSKINMGNTHSFQAKPNTQSQTLKQGTLLDNKALDFSKKGASKIQNQGSNASKFETVGVIHKRVVAQGSEKGEQISKGQLKANQRALLRQHKRTFSKKMGVSASSHNLQAKTC